MIANSDPDTDPETPLNPDTDPDPQHWLTVNSLKFHGYIAGCAGGKGTWGKLGD